MIRLRRTKHALSILLLVAALEVCFAGVASSQTQLSQTQPGQGGAYQEAPSEVMAPYESGTASTRPGSQSPFLGSVPSGKATPEVLQLSL